RACFFPVASMPSAPTMQCSPTWTPSMTSAPRSRVSSGVDRQVLSCAVVLATNRRLTALLLVPREMTSAPVGSKLRAYWRVATPISICSTIRRLSGSVSANLKRRQRDFVMVGSDPRPANRHFPPAKHDLARRRAGPCGRPLALMVIPWAADRRPILLEHRVEDFQP